MNLYPTRVLAFPGALAFWIFLAQCGFAQQTSSNEGKSGQNAAGTTLPGNPGCDDCNSCQKSSKSCLQKICDWVGYAPMRTGSTFGYPRTWKRRPDLYLYFANSCKEGQPIQGICEPCNRYVPASGQLQDLGTLPLPQPVANPNTKD